jgi:hypothetical protein
MLGLLSGAGDLPWEQNLARLYEGFQHFKSDGLKQDPLHALYAFMNVLATPSPPQLTLSQGIPPLDIPQQLGILWVPTELDSTKQSQGQGMITEETRAHPFKGGSIQSASSLCREGGGPGLLDTEAAVLASQTDPRARCGQSPPSFQAGSSCAVSSTSARLSCVPCLKAESLVFLVPDCQLFAGSLQF